MIFDSALAAARDDDHRFNARRDRFFDDILDKRLVDQGQHFFRRCFGRRQKSRAQSGGGKDCFANLRWHNNFQLRSSPKANPVIDLYRTSS